MQKVKVKLTHDAIYTLCDLWKQVVNSIPQNKEELKNKSIAEIVLIKLHKKQIERAHKKSDFNMSFEVHEAIVLDELLRPVMYNNTTVYQQAQIRNMIDFINQKTA